MKSPEKLRLLRLQVTKRIFFLVALSLLGVLKTFPVQALVVPETNSSKELKYNLSVCSIFKNEAPFLKEWIEYYKLVGVDHFYLYDNGSTDRSIEVLKPYLKEGTVTLVNWPDCLDEKDDSHDVMWAVSTQLSAYENATHFKASDETKWLIFLDVNEFLVSPEMNRLQDLLEKYEDYAGITLETDFFDAMNIGKLPPRKLVIESVELTAPELNPPKEVTKTIFKPNLCIGLFWPPCECRFQDVSPIAVKKSELRVNRYLNRSQKFFNLGKRKEKLNIDNRLLSEVEIAELLNEGYEIEDKDYAIGRFIPWLLKKLGYDSWNW